MVQKMRLGAPDVSGRQAPEVIEGADYVEDADLVIKALGFEPEDLPTLWDCAELPKSTRWGTIKAEYVSGATEADGVYAVGDIVRGASLVVWAIRDGRDCAEAILKRFAGTAAMAAENRRGITCVHPLYTPRTSAAVQRENLMGQQC